MEPEGPTKSLEFLVVLAIDRIPTKEFLKSQDEKGVAYSLFSGSFVVVGTDIAEEF
ncbi:hypothetical protein Goklo_002751 [Gossypium klotzschianum]|uniref:Uncharacterized protein n=1 Tax=Gossypium klotzschianum TaxID=34286 RepID=A0A7J8VV88_9ROSI|nr:hypothetical protein [Gossypium klotzschianum]